MFRTFKFFSLMILLFAAVGLSSADFTFLSELPQGRYYDLDGESVIVSPTGGHPTIYVRSGNGWVEQATLTPTIRVVEWWERYGTAAALDGDTAVVTSYGQEYRGEPGEPTGPGSLFIFKRSGTTWTHQQEIKVDSQFGQYVDVDGNTIIVSNEGNYDSYVHSVLFFQNNGTSWVQTASFDTFQGPNHNARVKISGDVAVAVGESPLGSNVLEVLVYKRSGATWVEQPTLPLNGALDLSGNTLINGSQVYVTDGNNWSLQSQLIPSENAYLFGAGAALDGNTAIVSGTDKSFIFTRNGSTWTQKQKLTLNGANIGNRIVDISGSLAQVGYRIFAEDNPPVVQEMLLVNGSFETDSDNNYVPDGWNRKNAPNDIRRCNKAGQAPISYSGSCAYLMKGGTTTDRKLVQNVDLAKFDLNAGDVIRLNGFYNKESVGDVVVWLYISYSDRRNEQARVKMTKTTSGYMAIPSLSAELKAKPTRVRVELWNQTTSGKTWLDEITLTKTSPTGSAELIPLP